MLSGGEHDFDVEDLKINTKYTGGYSEGSRTVKLFWEVSHNEIFEFLVSLLEADLSGVSFYLINTLM